MIILKEKNAMMLRNQFFCCFLLVLAHVVVGQTPQDAIPTDPAIRMGKLDNGILYFIRLNEKPEDRAELRLAVHAGSNQEDDDQQGLAHFVEHMAFNGTKNFEKSELVDYLESIGTRFGPDLNAYTSFDETVYMLQARTDTMALLEKGLLILEDWAQGVTFEDEEIDKERGVVLSEYRSRLGAEQRMQNKWLPIVYKGSRYADRLPIGKPEIIENGSYETVKRFYNDWYRPELMSVIAVGDFDLDWMEKEIITRFSKIAAKEGKDDRKDYDIPMHKETRVAVVTDPEASFTRVQLSYKHPHVATKNLSDFRQGLVRSLYNRMLSARLEELTQQADPPFTFGYSGYGSSFSPLVDEYDGYAFASEGQSMKALKALLVENKRVLNHGFLSSELERAKTNLMKRMESSLKEKDKTESRQFAMQLVYHFLENNPIPSVEQRFALYEQLMPGIELEEINQLAQRWITKENRTVIISGPEKEGLVVPTDEEILALLDEVDGLEVGPYEDQVSDEPLLAAQLEAIEFTDEVKHEELGITELTLANGIKVVLKPTDFKNDEINMESFSNGGHSLVSDEDFMEATSITSILGESGIGNFNSIELGKKLTGKKVRVNPYISSLTEGIDGSCSPDDLETMFQLTYLAVTQPRKDADALKAYVAKQKSFFSNMMSNPQYYFYSQSSKIKFGDHPRRQFPPKIEDLESIDLDRAFEIFQDRFTDLDDLTFIFVGNFEEETIKPLIAKYIGNLPTSDRTETWKDLDIDLVKGKVEELFYRGATPKSLIDMTWHSPYDGWEAEERMAYNFMISVLRIKLREAMREDEGGVYGVRVSGFSFEVPRSLPID